MSKALRIGSVLVPALALVLGLGFNYLIGLGGEECEVYCRPGGLIIPLLLFGIVPLLWLMGLVNSLLTLVRSRARGWWAWAGIGLSLVIPIALAVMYLATH